MNTLAQVMGSLFQICLALLVFGVQTFVSVSRRTFDTYLHFGHKPALQVLAVGFAGVLIVAAMLGVAGSLAAALLIGFSACVVFAVVVACLDRAFTVQGNKAELNRTAYDVLDDWTYR